MSAPVTHDEVVEATRNERERMVLQRVPVNVYVTADALVVVAPFPAVQASDVTVEVQGDKLRIFGELRSAGPRDFIIEEWSYGGYEREVDLPPEFGAGVEASLANGQLAVRVLRGNQSDSPIRIQPVATASHDHQVG